MMIHVLEYLCRGGSDKNWDAGQYNVILYVLLSPTVYFHFLASLVLLSDLFSSIILLYSSNYHLYLEVHLKGVFQGQINIYMSN